MTYLPALDGLRAIAVLMVMCFHLHLNGWSLGWAGVPLFFVLSGFLITSILLSARAQPLGSYLSTFYLRRSLRIFPLYYGYLAVNAVLMTVIGQPLDEYWWYLSYLQNYQMALERNSYWPGVVGHTWSLAIEEQFYLVWPFVVYFLPRRALLWTCVACVAGAPLVRLGFLAYDGNIFMANLTLPSCIDMLAYGALLAVLRAEGQGARVVVLLGVLGAGLTGLAVLELGMAAFWSAASWTVPAFYLYTALALVGGALIWYLAGSPGSVSARLLSWGPLRYTGKISYGLYIWHPLCFQIIERLVRDGRIPAAGPLRPLLALLLAFAVATLSFYLFERVFLRLKDRVGAGTAAPAPAP